MNPQNPAQQGNQAPQGNQVPQGNQAPQGNQVPQGNQAPQNNNQGGALTNANVIYQQDQRQDIGQATAQPGTLMSYETVPKDDGIGNPSDVLAYQRVD